jgi:hypothetical protein
VRHADEPRPAARSGLSLAALAPFFRRERSDENDVFFAERSDTFIDAFSEVDTNRCDDSRVLFSGRRRLFR